jgi:hypothetical protein
MVLHPELREMVANDEDGEQDVRKIVKTLTDAALLASRVEPSRLEEFAHAAGFAEGFMLGEGDGDAE